MNIKEWPQRLTNLFQRADRENTRNELSAPKNRFVMRGITEANSLTALPPQAGEKVNLAESPSLHRVADQDAVEHSDAWTDNAERLRRDREAQLQQPIEAWSGKSVHDLVALGLETVYDEHRGLLTDLLAREKLLSTVPENYRGQVWEARRESSNPFEAMGNSLAGTRSSATIIAFDQSGQAFVQSYVVDDYLGAEGWDFKEMSQKDALTLVSNYRASHEIVKEFRSDVLPSSFEYPENDRDLRTSIMAQYRDGDSLQEITPESGKTYRGDILHRTNDWIAQDIGEGRYVVHNAKCLVGAIPSLDAYSEIHYPRGQVGIVQEVTHGAELAMLSRQTSYGEHAL